VATTSSRGRYRLRSDLAALFDPALTAIAFQEAAEQWRNKNLSSNALAATKILRLAATSAKTKVSVMLPTGEARVMAPGLSSIITKAVIEVFAPRFLVNPAVLWISESGNKVVEEDDSFLKTLGINIDPAKLLPDTILADVGGGKPLFVFVEVVSSDGPINETRRQELLNLVTGAGFGHDQILFLTAFQSRDHPAFKKAVASLAWGSFAWCLSEPDHLIAFDGASPPAIKKLNDLAARE
jgi:hypothetical protein